MKETFIKIFINIVVLGLAVKILYSTTSNLSIWENSSEFDFLTPGYNGDNCTIIKTVDLNEKIVNKLEDLRKTLFFKIFKVNLDQECSHFTQSMICNFPSCGVCQCDDKEIPLPWKQESKSREELNIQIEDNFQKWTDKYNKSTSQWILDSEVESLDGTYVNLLHNPEAYTGYQGQHIWNAIFRENCFSDNLAIICTEEKVFYKIFSGLLANINIHISSNYYDQVRNYSYVNLTMFNERVTGNKERVDNLFFLFSLMVKAFVKAESLIKNFEIHTGNSTEDELTLKHIDQIYNMRELKELSSLCKQNEDEVNKFLNFHRMDGLIMRFRNISSIVNCVSCQKCKLHGKLQVYGIATMMKILSNRNGGNFKVSRNELIAFVNFFGKVSRAINYIKRVNENIKYGKFVHKFKYGFVLVSYLFIFLYINLYLFRKRADAKINEKNDKFKERNNEKHKPKHN